MRFNTNPYTGKTGIVFMYNKKGTIIRLLSPKMKPIYLTKQIKIK